MIFLATSVLLTQIYIVVTAQVIPAKAGIQFPLFVPAGGVDSRLRGNDNKRRGDLNKYELLLKKKWNHINCEPLNPEHPTSYHVS